jgi:hypothetical protein
MSRAFKGMTPLREEEEWSLALSSSRSWQPWPGFTGPTVLAV